MSTYIDGEIACLLKYYYCGFLFLHEIFPESCKLIFFIKFNKEIEVERPSQKRYCNRNYCRPIHHHWFHFWFHSKPPAFHSCLVVGVFTAVASHHKHHCTFTIVKQGKGEIEKKIASSLKRGVHEMRHELRTVSLPDHQMRHGSLPVIPIQILGRRFYLPRLLFAHTGSFHLFFF